MKMTSVAAEPKPRIPAVFFLMIALPAGVTAMMLAVTSPWFSPLYWLTFPIGVVVGLLVLPLRPEIRGLRPKSRPKLGLLHVIVIFCAVGSAIVLTGDTRSALQPLISIVAGFPLGMGLGTIYLLLSIRRFYCPTCGSLSGFARYHGRWVCGTCGTPHDSNEPLMKSRGQ